MTWIDEYIGKDYEREYSPVLTAQKDGAFFDPGDESGIEKHGDNYQGVGEVLVLSRDDIQALLDGKVLAIGVNWEYQLLVVIR